MEKDAEILSVGKIAESARFAEEEDLSLKTDFVSSSEASYGWLPSVAFVERHRGQVPLNFDKGRNQREEVCDEGVGLWGESQVSNDFPKIVDKIPDDRGWNRGKPGVVEMLESLFALADYRPSLSTLTFEGGDLHWRLLHCGRRPCTRRTALRQVSWHFVKMTRVLRQSGVIDSCLLWLS